MRVFFSDHAVLKLRQRNLDRQKVIQTLKKPDYHEASYGKRQVVYKKFRTLYLKVVFVERKGVYFVVTQHWDQTFNPNIYEN